MGLGISVRVCTYNLAEDDFRDCSYEAILRRLRASTGHRKFDVVPAPVIADRLISFARFGNLPVRFTFGQDGLRDGQVEGGGIPASLWP